MSTLEHRKRKTFGGAIRLFQISVQEMGTTDKHPCTQNSQNKRRQSLENILDQKDNPSVCHKEDNGEQKSSLCTQRKEVIPLLQTEESSARSTLEKESHGMSTNHRVSSARTTPEKESHGTSTNHTVSSGRTTPDKESHGMSTNHRVSSARTTPEKESHGTSTNHTVSSGRTTPDKESHGTSTNHRLSSARTTLEKDWHSTSARTISEPESHNTSTNHTVSSRRITPEKESQCTSIDNRVSFVRTTPEKELYSTSSNEKVASQRTTPEKESKVPSQRTTPEKESHSTSTNHRISLDIYPQTPPKDIQTTVPEREVVTCNSQKLTTSYRNPGQTTPQKTNDLNFRPYSSLPKEKTPPRFWKYKFKEEESQCHKDSSTCDSNLSSQQKLSICDTDKNNNVPTQSDKMSVDSSYQGNRSQNPDIHYSSQQLERDSQLHRRPSSYDSYRQQYKQWYGSSNNQSFYHSRGGYHHHSRGGYNRYQSSYPSLPLHQDGNTSYKSSHSTGVSHDRYNIQDGNTSYKSSHPTHVSDRYNIQYGNTSYNSSHSFRVTHDGDTQQQTDTTTTPTNHCIKGNTQAEDWSSELLNISDWNNDKLLEKHMDKLSVCNISPVTFDLQSQQSVEEESVWSEVDVGYIETSSSKRSENYTVVDVPSDRGTVNADSNEMEGENLYNNTKINGGKKTQNVAHNKSEQWIIEDNLQGETTLIEGRESHDEVINIKEETNLNHCHLDSDNVPSAYDKNILTQESESFKDDKQLNLAMFEKSNETFVDDFVDVELSANICRKSGIVNNETCNIRSSSPLQNKHCVVEREFLIDTVESENVIMECEPLKVEHRPMAEKIIPGKKIEQRQKECCEQEHIKMEGTKLKQEVIPVEKTEQLVDDGENFKNKYEEVKNSHELAKAKHEQNETVCELEIQHKHFNHEIHQNENYLSETEVIASEKQYPHHKNQNPLSENDQFEHEKCKNEIQLPENELMINKGNSDNEETCNFVEHEPNQTIKHLEMHIDGCTLIGTDHDQSGTYQECVDKYELVSTDHENDVHGMDEILNRKEVISEQEHNVIADEHTCILKKGTKSQHDNNVQLEREGLNEYGMQEMLGGFNAGQQRTDCQVESDTGQFEDKSVENERSREFMKIFDSVDMNVMDYNLINNVQHNIYPSVVALHFPELVHQNNSTDRESDVSAHFDDYDDLIKAKVREVKQEIRAKIQKQKHEKDEENGASEYDFLDNCYPDFEKRHRSRSLPGSPYMQVVELMQQFRHKHTERKFLLERQKEQQCRYGAAVFGNTHQNHTTPVMGRGRGKVSISQDSLTSESSTTPQGDEDWESDLIPLDDFLISDKNVTDDDTSDDKIDLNHDCQQDLKHNIPTPTSNSYMTINNTEVQQTPSPYYNKPYIPKGRGCLSPAFKENFNEFFIHVDQKKRLVVQERKGFNIHNHNEQLKSNVPFHQNKNQQIFNNPKEDWDNSLIDIECNEEIINVEHADKTGKIITEMSADRKQSDLIQNEIGCHGDTEYRNKEQFITPPVITNPNFINEYLEQIVVECDSSSMSSLPHCELLSPKSQSTLSGVPTMSDYENSEVGQLDNTKNDSQDEILDECFSDRETNVTNSLRSNNKLPQNSQCTGEFVVKNESENNNEIPISDQNKPTTAEKTQINDEDRTSHHYTSYYYPDLTKCLCCPSDQQYWVWHTCMCQVPRLCEIKTCEDYWLQYPFQDMDGIYQTTPIPDINNNRKCQSTDQRGKDGKDSPEYHGRTVVPPGFTKESRRLVLPPPMPLMAAGYIPPPPSRQIWEKMHGGQSLTQCRMSYRGPQPNGKDIPVHLVKHDSQTCRTVVSPFVCAQGYYQYYSNSVDSKKSRHKSENENGEQNDSGVAMEGSPGFIGPVLPRDVKPRSSSDSVSPVSAVRQLLGEGNGTPRKRLVDYSYSETDESEDDRSRSSQGEKRLKDSSGEVIFVTESNSDDDNSHKDTSKGRKVIESKQMTDSNFRKKDGEITDESDDSESSKFQECTSSFSNYQILQSVLNKKFPKNQRQKVSSKGDGDSDRLDLTDDGSEIISVASQESNEPEVKQKSVYQPFWASPGIRHDSPICGYPGMFAPYTYPGWVSQEMISAGYGSPSPEIVQQYSRYNSQETSPAENSSRTLTTSPADSVICQDDKKSPVPEEKEEDGYVRRGNVSIRGMAARLRFLNNSKLVENDTTFQSRLAQLQKSKHQDTDSDSLSSSSSWKVLFLRKCERYNGKYIDSHCHLDFLFTRSEYGGTWTKFKQDNKDTMPYNFEGCVAVFCHPSSFRSDGMWNKFTEEDDVWMTFGCHPKNATEYTEKTEMNLKFCLKNPRVVALGEIGLDYSGIFIKHKEVQQIAFRRQIQIALEMNKPLVIHCRDAEEDALAILDEMVPKNYKIHCHCFTGNYESAKKWMDMFPNLFIGLTPLVTYRTATSTHEVARFIPLERLLLETDSPYFIPRKCPRSEMQHSHPGMAITVAEEVAWLKKCPVSEVIQSCRQNTRLMYGI